MKSLKLLLFILLICVSPVTKADDYSSYLRAAQEHYSQGYYISALDIYEMYVESSGKSDVKLKENIDKCLKYSEVASQYVEKKDFKSAKVYYEKIVSINPSDELSKENITKMSSYIEKSKKASSYSNSRVESTNKFIRDWAEDLKIIVGFNSGALSSDVFGFYTEIKFRDDNGFALEAGYSPGILGYNTWSVGLKGYYYHFYLSAAYGTLNPVWGDSENNGEIFIMSDTGDFFQSSNTINNSYGCSFLVGYDRCWKWFHFTIGVGLTVPLYNNDPMFAWNVGIGVNWTNVFD